MKKVNLIPNVITTFSLICGLFVIFKTNMIDPGATTYQSLRSSVFILMLAALADVMDGAVARILDVESEFGGFFDSLSDAVTFGVAPSVLVLKALSLTPATLESVLATSAAMVYSICGILRLVRYSVEAKGPLRDSDVLATKRKSFVGCPIPAAASAVVAMPLFFTSPEIEGLGLGSTWAIVACATALFLLGYLMISRFPFPSLKGLQFRMPSFQLVLGTTLLVVLLFYGLIYHLAIAFLLATWSYFAVALLLGLLRRR